MAYHVNPNTGRVGTCKAALACPFGDSSEHFDSAAEAYTWYEEAHRSQTVPAGVQRALDRGLSEEKVAEIRPVWAAPCINPNCATAAHDVRNPEKSLACFNQVKHTLSPGQQTQWALDQKRYTSKFYLKQREELGGLIRRYAELPSEEQSVLNGQLETIAQLHASAKPEWYTTPAKKFATALKDAEERAKRVQNGTANAYDLKRRAEAGDLNQRQKEVINAMKRKAELEADRVAILAQGAWPSAATGLAPITARRDAVAAGMESMIAPTVSATDLSAAIGVNSGYSMMRLAASHIPPEHRDEYIAEMQKKVQRDAAPQLTLEQCPDLTLAQLQALGERERAWSDRVSFRTDARRFRKDLFVRETETVYTDNYKTYSDFVEHLPPKSQQVHTLYQAALKNERLNQPEVLALLEEKYAAAKAEERDLFLRESTPLEEIESLLRERGI